MRVGLKTREVLSIMGLTFLVVAATTVVHFAQLTRIAVQNGVAQADLVSHQVYAQSQRALAAVPGRDPWQVLQRDRELRSLLVSSVDYAPDILYVFLVDTEGRVRLHSEGGKEGTIPEPKPDLRELFSLNPLDRYAVLYAPSRTYEASLPLRLNDRPFGSIQIGISTSLLRRELTASLQRGLALAGLALGVAWLVAIALANLVLKPLRGITREIGRLRQAEPALPGGLVQGDEFKALASELELLGQQLQSDRLKMLSEKAHLQQVVDQLEDALIFFGRQKQLLFLNKAAEDVLGLSMAGVAGRAVEELLEPGHPLAPLFERGLRDAGLRNATVALDLDGKRKEFVVSAFRLGESTEPMGTMVLLKDLDSIRTLQSLVSYSAKLTALGRLTSGVAHEVKNPLNAMMIHVELLKEKLANPSEGVRESLNIIGTEIRRLDRVLQGFLKFVRPQELALSPVDLGMLVRDAVAFLRPEWDGARVRFEVVVSPDFPIITADHELLRQVVLNILLNACQAMPKGGAIRVALEREGAEMVRLTVADEGVGIAPADLDRIFTLYYTTKAGGSGIGLSLVYRIVQMHDGAIQVASVPGRGTTVTIRLPIG
ncbi:MAG TPA: ATP-binding protein [Candidatus Sulfotelmatobacter sp.]|nr:ATP-binding protein [Candidatus Sulfotelmatobacter sp.]